MSYGYTIVQYCIRNLHFSRLTDVVFSMDNTSAVDKVRPVADEETVGD